MEKEYRVSVFGKVFNGLLTSGMVIFLSLLMISNSQENKLIYLVVSVPIVICIFVLINLFKSKVIITDTGITRKRIFYDRTLNFDQIKGVRIESKIIFIEPIEESYPKVKISNYDDLAKSEELTKWLREKFVDLNEVDRKNDKELLLNDNSLGYTTEERAAKISKMKQLALAYNIWGFAMCFILIFLRNNSLSFWVGILYPLLGIAIMGFSSGLIKFVSESQRSLHVGIFLGIAVSVINVLMTAIAGYEVLSFTNAWLIVAVITIALFILFYSTGINKFEGAPKGQIVAMLVTAFIYGFGNTIVVNCLFDRSTPKNFTTTIIDKYVSRGKGAHYHLKLNSWKTNGRIREVNVSRDDYDKAPIGSSILISERKGLFNIPWFDFNVGSNPPGLAD